MRLEISREALAGIRAAAAGSHPEEACGLLFGDDGLIDGWQQARNVAEHREDTFEIDPAALFAALRAERAGGPKLIGYWHSHPNGSVKPSQRDTEFADLDGRIWVIVANDDVAAWVLVDSPVYSWDERTIEQRNEYGVAIPTSSSAVRSFRHVPMATGEVRHLIPRDKSDEDMVPLIAEAGYPAIAPILDDLMGWTADPNWPICVPLIDYLNTLDDAMVEPIRRVLRGVDSDHKLLCLRAMVPTLPRAAQMQLIDDLRALAELPGEPDQYVDLHSEAQSIVARLSVSGV